MSKQQVLTQIEKINLNNVLAKEDQQKGQTGADLGEGLTPC